MQILSINQPHLKKIIIANLYRPPQGNISEFCDTLHDTIVSINSLINRDAEIFILGDVNINYLNPTSPGYRDIKWFEQRVGLQQLITVPMRYSHVNTCKDLIFTNCENVLGSGVLDNNISDHQPIFVTRKYSSKIKTKTNFTGRSYLNFDEGTFAENLVQLNWDYLYEINDVDVAWDFFISNVILTIDLMCPLRNLKIKNLKDPGITNLILENIHDKDSLLRQAKRSCKAEDWNIARQARNRLNLNIKNIKAEFIKENFERNQNDTKKFWKDIQIILPKSDETNLRICTLKNDQGEPIYDVKKAADFINYYFANVGPKLAQYFID